MSFNFIRSSISDVILITPAIHLDERGFFLEGYRKSEFFRNGIQYEFVQENRSRSKKGVLRGLHYQLKPHEQGKLVCVIRGRIFDVAVDIRKGSPTFGKWVSAVLSEDNGTMLWIPLGFAHGFLALDDATDVLYKVTNEYDRDSERGIIWNDPEISIKWPIKNPILFGKDLRLSQLRNSEINFSYGEDDP